MNFDNGEVPSTAFLPLASKNLVWGNVVNFQLYSEGLNIIPGDIRSMAGVKNDRHSSMFEVLMSKQWEG